MSVFLGGAVLLATLTLPLGALGGGCTKANLPPNSIDVLVQTLNTNTVNWTAGIFPSIRLASNASPQEIVEVALTNWWRDGLKFPLLDNRGGIQSSNRKLLFEAKIKNIRIIEVRKVGLTYKPNCSAVLFESGLGRYILLCSYEGEQIGWWTRFVDMMKPIEPTP